MRKGFLMVLAVVLVAAMAVPAMAGTDINGFYRVKGFVTNFKEYTGGAYRAAGTVPTIYKNDESTNAYVEHRFRLKFTSGEENVKAVAFFEIDSVWGDQNAGRNTGASLAGDAANLETKNVYVWFKLPNTSLDFTVGLQGQSDSYAGVFFAATDMAGIFVNGKMDPVSYRLGWAKWNEGLLHETDDRTLYLAEAKFAPAKDVKLGLNFYMLADDRNRHTPAANGSIQRVYMPGFDATFGAGPATINAFAFFQTGKQQDFLAPGTASADVKISGFAGDLRADLNLGPGKAFVEGLYVSGGDDPTVKFKSIVDSGFTNQFYARTDMQILLLNADDIGTASGVVTSLGNGGRGTTHLAAGYSQKLGDKLSGKVGAGYLAATKKLKTDGAWVKKAMGTEFNANVNYNIMKGLDFGVYAAYAWIGDFFKRDPAVFVDQSDPDDAYDLHFRLNYAF